MTDAKIAFEYCEGLYQALVESLCVTSHVNDVTERLRSMSLSPTFPEVRFCKGCVLPVVDEFTTQFLTERFSASKGEIHSALRCEGFQTLGQYYDTNEKMSGYSGSPWNRDKIFASKSGSTLLSGANPDFCVRYNQKDKLRIVGEVKYLPKRKSSNAGIKQILNELRHYLAIPSSSHSDWGHDFGFGLMYSGSTPSPQKVELLQDMWAEDNVMIAYFHD